MVKVMFNDNPKYYVLPRYKFKIFEAISAPFKNKFGTVLVMLKDYGPYPLDGLRLISK